MFKKICIKDGVSKIMANIYYFALKHGGKPSTEPKTKREYTKHLKFKVIVVGTKLL
ncbi:MAG: hypothetical protein GQ534_02665 [Candidatus Delongbacteria bacterium]|nr:hypothetical protein [Candidatus Delongbacteria bacterium]